MICESLLSGMILQYSMLSCECQLQIGTYHWHLSSTSARIKTCAPVAADFPHPLRGVQGGKQKGPLCLWGQGGNWQNRSADSYIPDFISPIFISPCI